VKKTIADFSFPARNLAGGPSIWILLLDEKLSRRRE
jgi:hypothetical protein